MLTSLLNSFGGYIVAAVVAMVAVAGAYLRGRLSGKAAERVERDAKINEQVAQARQEVQEVRAMKWLLRVMMLSLLSWQISGCASRRARVGVEYCDHARPIWLDSAEQVKATPAPVRRQVRDLNRTWQRLCGQK